MKLALGTAQIGLPYGITNHHGQIDIDEARRIIFTARDNDIDMLDTAINYGDSQERLGEIGVSEFKIVSKLPSISSNSNVTNWVNNNIHKSLKKLMASSLYGLLLHRPKELLGRNGKELWASLEMLKNEGFIQKLGISIYSPNELEKIVEVYDIDIVQAPFNIFDRRMEVSGWFQRLHDMDIEIHVRSIFLQGLLLMPVNHVPKKFNQWMNYFNLWHAFLEKNNLSPQSACISFIRSKPMIDRIVIGVDKSSQLVELLSDFNGTRNEQVSVPDLSCNDEDFINPVNWNM